MSNEKPVKEESPDLSFNKIEAIAFGVEARQEMLDLQYEKVVQQTIHIARSMGFPEETIQKWASIHSEEHSRRVKQIVDSITRPESNQS